LASADGRLAAAVVPVPGNDRAVVVTEAATGRERFRIPFNLITGYLSAAEFSPDGGLLYTVGPYQVAVWDTATGRRVRTLAEQIPAAEKMHPFLSVAASPGGRYVAVFADSALRRASDCGTCNAIAPDDRAKTVSVWDTRAWRLVRTVPVPGGSWFFWQTDDRFTIETVARRPADPRDRWAWLRMEDDPSRVDPVRFDPAPNLGPHEVEAWTVTGGRVRAWRFDPPPRERLVPAPDGRTLAGFDPENPLQPGVRLYEAETGRVRHPFMADERCRSAAFSPDGRYLLTDHPGLGVQVWDLRRATNGPSRLPTESEQAAAWAALAGDDSAAAFAAVRRLATDAGGTVAFFQRQPAPAGVRAVRAVEAVEWIGTADAVKLLEGWAAPPAGDRLRVEAAAALARLRDR
jgi:WD40 repeat protein